MASLINLPGYQVQNALLNFAPLSDAIDSNRKNALMQDQMGMQREQMAQRASQFDRSFGLQQKADDRQAQMLPYTIKKIDQEIRLGQQRGASEAQLAPLKAKLLEAEAYAKRAHGGLYEAQAQGVGQRSDVAMQRAATERAQVAIQLAKQFPNPEAISEQQWGQAQPMLVGIFGREVPYLQRAQYIPKIQALSQEPELTPDMVESGITLEDFREAKRRKLREEIYGDPNKKLGSGYMWGPNGQMVPIPGSKATEADKQRQIMGRVALSQLDAAEKTLTEGNMVTNALGQVTGIGDKGQAYADYQNSVLQMVYALSGKQTTNAEMNRFLSMYMPSYGDSEKRIKDKSDRIRSFMKSAVEASTRGIPYDQFEQQFIAKERGLTDRGPAQSRYAPQNPPVPGRGGGGGREDLMKKYGLE